jgi:hypothetical protein
MTGRELWDSAAEVLRETGLRLTRRSTVTPGSPGECRLSSGLALDRLGV